jgi:membrane-associated phospholipid phosphatase
MDSITSAALGIQDPLIKAAGMLLDGPAEYVLIVLGLMLAGERRKGKLIKILASLAVAFALGMALKHAMAYERPCAGMAWCLDDFSFPSMHATIAFTLMTGFLNKRSFPLYLLFALFVSFTRLNLGVHVFLDIAGALPVALTAYYITDIAWRREGKAEVGGDG